MVGIKIWQAVYFEEFFVDSRGDDHIFETYCSETYSGEPTELLNDLMTDKRQQVS